MSRFEVIPAAVTVEAQRLGTHPATLAQVGGTLHAAGADAVAASGHDGAAGALGALHGTAAGALAQLEASVHGLAAATHAAARRYVNTDESLLR
jgi:hypothetical protein